MAMRNPRNDVPEAPAQSARTSASILPGAMIDPALRDRLLAEYRALAASKVRRTPAYMSARIMWAKTLCTTAEGDAEELVKVPLKGGRLTHEQIHELGARVDSCDVLFQRWRDAGATGATRVPGAKKATPTTATTRKEIEAIHKRLLRAFDMLFEKDDEGKALLYDIRVKASGSNGLNSASVRILRLCNSAEHADWLAELPKGEALDAARLAVLQAGFLRNRASDRKGKVELKRLLDRAWTVTSAVLDRVRSAGVYHVGDDPERADDYAPFRAPTTPASRVKAPVVVDPPAVVSGAPHNP